MIKPNNCEMCGKEEFDGCWIKKNESKGNFHYICYRCINDFCDIIEKKVVN